jgi:hypothetical protein
VNLRRCCTVKCVEPETEDRDIPGRRDGVLQFEEMAMLAEIFLLRLEAAARASEASQTSSTRFVPLTRSDAAVLGKKRSRDSRDNA